MPDCDYCSASFDDEDAYDEHLADEHADELGPIDRRRVEQRIGGGDSDGVPTGPLILFGVIGFALLVVAYVILFMGGGSGDLGSLPEQGDSAVISEVTTEPSTGNDHVSSGTDIDYERVPPTSGTHYSATEQAGFYEETRPLGSLVHTLEHGAVVVYYDPSQLSSSAESELQSHAESYTGTWASFVAVPNPNDNPESAYVLTAWEKRLTMDQYDDATVEAFIAEYLGRGPENPVR